MSSFGKYIKEKRELLEWTQTEFGAKIGINTSAISRIENGTQKFSKSKLSKLAKLFNESEQIIKDKFFADKFAREAYKYGCSESIFQAAEETSKYLKSHNKRIAV
jgi:transcriptional regulator with XRE-family HTH domain